MHDFLGFFVIEAEILVLDHFFNSLATLNLFILNKTKDNLQVGVVAMCYLGQEMELVLNS